jgi:ribose transport system permease protein
MNKIDKPVLIAFGCSAALVVSGSFFFPRFLTATYLLQQLQMASFLGIVATGAMVVILMGHFDLSVPWGLTAAGIASTAIYGGALGPGLAWASIPAGLVSGVLIGLINGSGVAYLRLPSMIWTLGVNFVVLGVCVFYTGGFLPPGEASGLMRWVGIGKSLGGVPNAIYLWLAIALIIVFVLRRTKTGRYIYAIGNSERVTYLAGVNTNGIIVLGFVISGLCNAIAGMALAGYAQQAYQAMGEPYLLPAIAAVVLGGTNVLGGSGSYIGTVAGVILITLITSILSVVQIPEAGRQIIYGIVIIFMVLFYARGQQAKG